MAKEKFTEEDLDNMVLKALNAGEKTVLGEGQKKSVKDRLMALVGKGKTPRPTAEGETE